MILVVGVERNARNTNRMLHRCASPPSPSNQGELYYFLPAIYRAINFFPLFLEPRRRPLSSPELCYNFRFLLLPLPRYSSVRHTQTKFSAVVFPTHQYLELLYVLLEGSSIPISRQSASLISLGGLADARSSGRKRSSGCVRMRLTLRRTSPSSTDNSFPSTQLFILGGLESIPSRTS